MDQIAHAFTKVNMMLLYKAPHLSYGEKEDLIENVFVPQKNFCFPETTRSFKYKWLLLLPWLSYSPSEDASYCLSCVLFGHDFPIKASWVKNLFPQPSGALELIVKAKIRKLILHMNLFKAFIFQHWLNLKLFFLKSKAQVLKLMCYVIENITTRLKKTVRYYLQ